MVRYLSLLLFIGLALGQSDVDPIEATRRAKAAAEKAQAKGRQLSPIELREIRNRPAAEAELDALAKAAAEKAKRKLAQELGLDYEKAIVLKTAVIYLLNGERIDGDIVEIVAADKYIVVRTESLERRRISYAYIDYIRHNNNGLTDYLQAAGKEPEPEPPKPVILIIIVDPPETNISVGYKQYKANADGIVSIELPAGKHEIFFSLSGYKPQTQIITLRANWETNINVQMYLHKSKEEATSEETDAVKKLAVKEEFGFSVVENKYISKRTKRNIALVITGAILITIYADINNTSFYGWN